MSIKDEMQQDLMLHASLSSAIMTVVEHGTMEYIPGRVLKRIIRV